MMLVIEKFPYQSTVKVTEAVEECPRETGMPTFRRHLSTERIYMPANFIGGLLSSTPTMALGIRFALII